MPISSKPFTVARIQPTAGFFWSIKEHGFVTMTGIYCIGRASESGRSGVYRGSVSKQRLSTQFTFTPVGSRSI